MTNGFKSWARTHHEIVSQITLALEWELMPRVIENTLDELGNDGLYELCIDLTNQFEIEHDGVVWDGKSIDTMFIERIAGFLDKKLS